jgi:hypothetical protein
VTIIAAPFKMTKLRLPVPLTAPYLVRSGGCWIPFASPSNDLPCGFTDLGSLLAFFLTGTPAFSFDAVYSMSWVSKASGVLAYAPANVHWASPTAVLYMTVAYAPHAWYSLEQVQVPVTPRVQPMASASVCKTYGLTWVAIALDTPATPSHGDGAGCTWFSCEFGWPPYVNPILGRPPVNGTLTAL